MIGQEGRVLRGRGRSAHQGVPVGQRLRGQRAAALQGALQQSALLIGGGKVDAQILRFRLFNPVLDCVMGSNTETHP